MSNPDGGGSQAAGGDHDRERRQEGPRRDRGDPTLREGERRILTHPTHQAEFDSRWQSPQRRPSQQTVEVLYLRRSAQPIERSGFDFYAP